MNVNWKQVIFVAAIVVILLSLMGSGCTDSATYEQRSATRESAAVAHDAIGMPNIVNWTQKRHVKELYELLDQEDLITYSYIVNMQGEFVFLCESLGYGIPASVQFSNPQTYSNSSYSMPQAEPNQLFMPEGLSATYIKCVNDGRERVIYVEPEIIVSPYRLEY